MRTCLIVQFEPRHEEVIPSLIVACNAAGYRPRVVLNRRIRRLRGDIFSLVQAGEADISYERLSPDAEEGAFDLNALLGDDVDFVLMNTLNRTKAIRWALECGKPVIGIVHNVDQFMAMPALEQALTRPDFAVLALGAHVVSELNARLEGRHIDKLGLLTPCVLNDPPEVQTYEVPQMRRVVVQGNISLRTRNFQGLIDALGDHPGRWDNLTFDIPSSGGDRATVQEQINERGLGGRLCLWESTATGSVPYEQVFECFRSATFFHPLIPEDFLKYQRVKITSSVSMSVAFGVPIIMDRWSQTCYRFPMLVSDNTLEASLDRLSQVDASEVIDIRSALRGYRQQMILQSGQELTRLIAQIL